eukprot:8784221-Lingulodinium_polyedra.AAC.1
MAGRDRGLGRARRGDGARGRRGPGRWGPGLTPRRLSSAARARVPARLSSSGPGQRRVFRPTI